MSSDAYESSLKNLTLLSEEINLNSGISTGVEDLLSQR